MKAKRGRGRPKMSKSKSKNVLVAVRFSRKEIGAINSAVRKSKKSKSYWIREALLGAVEGQL